MSNKKEINCGDCIYRGRCSAANLAFLGLQVKDCTRYKKGKKW